MTDDDTPTVQEYGTMLDANLAIAKAHAALDQGMAARARAVAGLLNTVSTLLVLAPLTGMVVWLVIR